MRESKFAYAIWPWGTKTKEQYVTAVQEISDVGYTYYESVRNSIDVFLNNIADFKAINAEYGVTPVSFYFHLTGVKETDIGELEQKLPFMAENGIHRISLQGMGAKEGRATLEQLDYTLKTITEIGRLCKEYEIIPCVHPHHGTSIMYEDEIAFIMDNTDPDIIGFGPDTAHLVAGLCDPVAIFSRYAKRIGFTHLKDITGSEVISTGFAAGVQVYDNFRELGQGNIDFPAIFNILKSANYDGYLTVELDRTRTTHKESARVSLEYLKANY